MIGYKMQSIARLGRLSVGHGIYYVVIQLKTYMPVLKAKGALITDVKPGVQRRLIHTDNLMMVVIDFSNGPWEQPDPAHSHVHEQITYVVEGEILFFCQGEQEQRLKSGDMFSVPSGRDHGIQLLSPTAKLIDCFTPVREDFLV